MHEGCREQGPQANQPDGNTEETGIRVIDHPAIRHQNIPQTANHHHDSNKLPFGIIFEHVAVMNEQRDSRVRHCIQITADNANYPAELKNNQVQYYLSHFRAKPNPSTEHYFAATLAWQGEFETCQ